MIRVGNKQAFTIVELLIVVVVIAILAAVTIVAYNGITNRAKESAAQSEASQAAKKIATEMIKNGEQVPEDIAAFGLKDGNGTTYQYSRNTSSTPQTFCLTSTKNGISYYTTSTNTNPQKGACPGHGRDGVAPITNLVINPQVNAYTTSAGPRISTGRWFGSGGTGTYTIETGSTPVGNTFARKAWSSTPTTGSMGDTGYNGGTLTVTPGGVYTISAYVRTTKARWQEFGASIYKIGSSTSDTRHRSSSRLLPINSWVRVSWTYTVPEDVDRINVLIDILNNSADGAGTWADGDKLDVTGYMITEGPTLYNFADGNSTNWVWNGTPNASTSQGPPSS